VRSAVSFAHHGSFPDRFTIYDHRLLGCHGMYSNEHSVHNDNGFHVNRLACHMAITNAIVADDRTDERQKP
jgi:hypothetical protein